MHRQSTLKSLVEGINTLRDEEIQKTLHKKSSHFDDVEGIDDIDKEHEPSHDHDHTNHEEDILEFSDSQDNDDEIKVNVKPKETPDTNIQKLTCNQFELDFENVLVGEKKELSLMLYNGSNFPVTFKVDKTRANSKGFSIHPDQTLVLPGEPNNDKATKLQITFQNIMPKLPLGPAHVWVQMNVKEVHKLIDLHI